ncbi:MAG TPA: hypothetical protein VFW68_03240 [Rhodocyclaceae bacterium]|nr:hypothetical protein [Rhodocyclaceae bacterium]
MAIDIPEAPTDYDPSRIIERPDGFYWQVIEDGKEFGPFTTMLDAINDMEFAEGDLEVGEGVSEAESEIGVADWLDPDTGEPAEEAIPRIEEH